MISAILKTNCGFILLYYFYISIPLHPVISLKIWTKIEFERNWKYLYSYQRSLKLLIGQYYWLYFFKDTALHRTPKDTLKLIECVIVNFSGRDNYGFNTVNPFQFFFQVTQSFSTPLFFTSLQWGLNLNFHTSRVSLFIPATQKTMASILVSVVFDYLLHGTSLFPSCRSTGLNCPSHFFAGF